MRKFSSFWVLLAITLLVSSCAAKYPRTTIKEDHAVTSIFRSATINPNYNYFYYGIFLEPDSIMGIDKSYSVQTRFWTPLELSKEQLQTWIVALDRVPEDYTFASRYMGRYQGAHILDPQGRRIGMWYSKLDWGVFEFPEAHTIVPFVPSLRGIERDFLFRRDD